MSFLVPFVTNLLNKIVIGLGGIGLILQQGPGVPSTQFALQVWNTSKQVMAYVDLGGNYSASGSVTVRGAVTAASLNVRGVGSGRVLHAQDQLRSSGGLVVDGPSVVFGNPVFSSCTALETVNGALTCGSDDAGSGGGGASTGSLLNMFKNIFLASSTGAVKTNFGSQFVQSSTGSLRSLFNSLYLQTSTGSLKSYFDGQYFRSSTGSLKTYFDVQYFRSSTGALKIYFDQQYLRTSTGSLKVFFDANYFRSSSGSLKVYFDKLYTSVAGDTMTGGLLIVNGGAGTQSIDAGLLLEVAGTASGRSLHAQDSLASSGTLVVRGASRFQSNVKVLGNLSGQTLNVDNLKSCDTIDTDSAGRMVCGSDSTGTTNNFGTGNVVTIVAGTALMSSTGSLKASFGTQFVQSSTGSLRVLFNSLYFQSSTGSLAAYFRTLNDNRYVNTSGDTMTGALNVRANLSGSSLNVSNLNAANCDVKSTNGVLSCGTDASGGAGTFGTGNVMTLMHATDNSTSTGALTNAFKSIFIASSTGTLANAYKNIFLASSTGALKANFGLQFLQSSTGSLRAMFLTLNDNRYVNTSGDTMTGALKVRANLSGSTLNVDNLRNCDTIDTDSAGRLACGTDSTAGSGLDQVGADKRYVQKQGDTMTGKLLVNLTSGTDALEVVQVMSGGTINGAGGLVSIYGDATYLSSISLSDVPNNPLIVLSTKRAGARDSTLSLSAPEAGQASMSATNNVSNMILFDETGNQTFHITANDTPPEGSTFQMAAGNASMLLSTKSTGVNATFTDQNGGTAFDINGDPAGTNFFTLYNVDGSHAAFYALSDTNATTVYVYRPGGAEVLDLSSSTTSTSLELSDSSGALFNIFGLPSGKSLTFEGSMSGQSLTLSSLKNCDTIDTNGNGVLSCGTDASGGGTGNFGTGNVITIISGTALTSSTGSLKTNFGLQFLQSSTGALAQKFTGIFLASSTGALANKFTNIFLASSTGALKASFLTPNDNRYVNTSGDTMTGSLVNKAASNNATISQEWKTQDGRQKGFMTGSGTLSLSGALKVRAGMSGYSLNVSGLSACTNLQTGVTGSVSCNNALYFASSTGSLAQKFTGIFLASSTGALANKFTGIFLASSTGSLKANFGLQFLQSSTGALAQKFTNIFLASSTGALANKFTNIFLASSTGAIKAALLTLNDNRYVNTSGDTMTGALILKASANSGTIIQEWKTQDGRQRGKLTSSGALSLSGSLKVRSAMSGYTLNVSNNAAVQGVLTLTNALSVANGGTALTSLPTRTIVLSAGGAKPSTLSGSVTKALNFATNAVDVYTQAFGDTLNQSRAQWNVTMPDSYNGGTMAASFYWTTTASSNSVKWFIQCRSLGDNEAIDQSWGSSGSVLDTAQTANTLLISGATGTITCAGTPAGGEDIQFRVFRNPMDGSDTMAATGSLLSVKIEYTTSSYTD